MVVVVALAVSSKSKKEEKWLQEQQNTLAESCRRGRKEQECIHTQAYADRGQIQNQAANEKRIHLGGYQNKEMNSKTWRPARHSNQIVS